MPVQEPSEAVKPPDAVQPTSAGEPARETPVKTDEPEPGIRRREVRLSDGRSLVYYEFERRS
jgi:hypothetical protein